MGENESGAAGRPAGRSAGQYDEFIKLNFKTMTAKAMAEHVGKSESTIRQRMRRLGLTKARGGKKESRLEAAPTNTKITIDFTGREKLLEDLRTFAAQNFRTCEQQALKFIDSELKICCADFFDAQRFEEIEEVPGKTVKWGLTGNEKRVMSEKAPSVEGVDQCRSLIS